MVLVVSLVSSLTYCCKLCIFCHTWASTTSSTPVILSLPNGATLYTILYVVMNPKHKTITLLIYHVILLLLWIVNIWYAEYLMWNPKGVALHAYLGSRIITRASLVFFKSMCPPVISEDLCFWQPSSTTWLNSVVVAFPPTYMAPQG